MDVWPAWPPELQDVFNNFQNGFSVNPDDATFFGNNTSAMSGYFGRNSDSRRYLSLLSGVPVLQRVMRDSRTSMLLAVLLAIGCNGFVGEATVKAPAAEKAVPNMTALDQARAALNRRGSGEVLGNISLPGTRSVVSSRSVRGCV
jgi:hypothetical protein